MTETFLFLIAQSVIIIGAIVTTYVRTAVAIAELKIRAQQIELNTDALKADHTKLAGKVDGVSRAVSRMEGRYQAEA